MGVTGYVLSVVAADLTVTLGLVFVTKIYKDISFSRFDKKTLRDMLKFSVPYIPTTILWLITSVSDRFVVTYFCGEDANGLYSAAYKIPMLLTLMCTVFIEAWQLSAVRDGGSSLEERQGFFGRVYKDYLCVMIAGASFLIASSQIFTHIFLAKSYFDSWQYVPILAIATMFSALSSFMGSVYFLEKKSIWSMLTTFSGAFVNVILNFYLIPKHGAMGAAVATLISYMTVYAVRVIDTRRYVKFNTHNIKLVINTLILAIQSVILLSGVKYSFFISLGLFCLVAIFNLGGIISTILRIVQKFLKKAKNN
jgi:O-antigen/teichoic acid export membrane protein